MMILIKANQEGSDNTAQKRSKRQLTPFFRNLY